MIDTSRSVILLAHPRSGSTWFQFNLPQKNFWELFNWGIKWELKNNQFVVVNKVNQFVMPDIVFERIEDFKKYEKKFGPISAKLHTLQFDKHLLDFFQSTSAQFVSITRKDYESVIWSYCIALITQEWIETVNTKEIYVDRNTFNIVIDCLRLGETNLNEIKKHVNVIDIIYEDALQFPKSEWWKNDHRTIKKQDAKNKIVITNREEVQGWIRDLVLP